MMYLLKATLVLIYFGYFSFAQTSKTYNPQAKADLIGELQKTLADEVAANPSLPGELLHITLPKQELDVSLAAGLFDRESKLPLDPHHLFRVASVTKTFTAASILRLYEEGKIKLDDPINRYLPKEYTEILEKGGYPTNVITVRQLLTHTSGIHDYADDPQYFAAIMSDPKHRWTRMEQIQAAIKWSKPHFEPGKGYHYSDTGYNLLGEMIERLSGESLAKAFRTLLDFKKLGLDETYLETLEPAPAGVKSLSHPYFEELDAISIDASHDLYGGGGLVSSVEDLARFYRALFNRKVFVRDSTLQTMLTVPPTNERIPGGAHGMGIFRRNISGNLCWGHNGFWGTSAYHCPASDVTVVRHYNQAEPKNTFIFNNLYEQIFNKLKIGMSKAQWREDLQYLARELPKRHKNLFHTVSREEFEKMVAELDRAIPTLDDYQIIVRMQEITAKVGDGHTFVHLPQTFKRYPLVLYWFGNELRVVRAVKEYKDALGAKVVKIGDVNINDVQTRIRKVLSQAENEWFVSSNSPFHLVSPEVLQTLGVVPDARRAVYTFETDEGKQFTLDVVPVVPDTSLNSLLIGAAKEEPLFRQKPTEPFWFTYLPDSQTVYVNFKGYNSLGENTKKLFQTVDANPTKKLVIDMRQNTGGDFTKVRELLIPAIKQRIAINQKGRLFVIVGRRTFSAAMTNAIDFRKETNAILVGEPIGERPNSYQENDEMKLPNSGIEVSYSTKYYKFLDEDAPAVMPDKRIDPNWLDYKAGRDTVMDWIISDDK
ncbi:MAG: class A beta-lactamase-related serine hydrolase [Acidobacteriota bacterium]|nr:class A beta-lactamase-related serine hydrolase [Acidobacteriota bacterium]